MCGEVALSRFTVLLGGDLTPTPRLLAQVHGTRAIAADSGVLHAPLLGLDVELWIGDFDSTPQEAQARLAHLSRLAYPVAKDKTDGELAVDAALERGATSLVLAGGLGGQADHALANIMLAKRLTRLAVPAMLTTGTEEAYPLHAGEFEVETPVGSRLSIVPITDLHNLSLSGVKWPLTARTVAAGSTLTLSNETTGGPVRISLGAGEALVLAYPNLSR